MPKKPVKPKRQQGKPYTKEQREKIIQSIKPYLQLDYDLKNACVMANAPYTTVISWVNKDPALCIQVEAWRNSVNAKSRQNLAKSISGGNIDDSKWWLERRDKESFSSRKELSGPNGNEINVELNFKNANHNKS